MDSSPSLGRRRLLAAGMATVLAGLAGCNDDEVDVDPGAPTSQAPGNTSVLVRADMALLNHEGTDRILEAYGSGGAEDNEVVAEFEGRTGLTAAEADVVVVFADQPRGDFAAFVVEGEWSESTAVESIESATDLDYEARDHEGGTVYEPSGGGADTDYLGYVADGRYAIGSEAAVEAAIETVHADRESVSGPLKDAFDDATTSEAEGTTYVTAATDDPRAYLPPDDSERIPPGVSLDVYEKATLGTVSYTAAESKVAIDAVLRADNESDAQEMADFTATVQAFLANNTSDDAMRAEFGKIDIQQEGTVVRIVYRSDVEGAVTLAGFL